MSDLLNSASLVMIPSGYKEDTVFSQIPTDGSGDLSFTRASNGTRINSAGLVEVCPWNLLEQSETFDTASWPKLECSITANSTNSPIGTLTADSLIESNTNSRHMIYRAFTSVVGQSYSLSVYCKQSTRRYANINLKTSSTASPRFSALFDLQTGLNVSTSAVGSPTGTSFDIVSFPNGWYRISISMNATSTSTEYEISTSNSATPSLAEGTPAYLGDGTSGIYIWGAQVNIGSTAKPYFPTTDRLNVPRLTYQNGGGGCPSLLLEKQSTNLIEYSEDFSGATWLNEDIIVSTNQTISPDGTQNADKLIANTTTLDHSIYQTSAGSTRTFSVYAKAGEYNYIFLGSNNNTASDGAFFNLSNGTISQNTSGLTASIESVGNGWYRCIVSSTSWPTIYTILCLSTNGTSLGFTGNNTSGIYVWGCQVENSSYPTSYIPTTSSSATRVADACFKTGISSLIGQTSGSVFFDFTVDSVTQPGDPVLWYMKDGGAGERYVELYSNGNLVYAEIDGSGPIATITKSSLTVGRHKCAIAYATNDFVFYVDGVQIGTDTSGTPNGFSTFGLQYYLSVYTGQQKVNQAAIFKTRLTNAELASLTTI